MNNITYNRRCQQVAIHYGEIFTTLTEAKILIEQ